MQIRKFPLCWPVGWERVAPTQRQKTPFSVTPTAAVEHLKEELRKLQVTNIEVSSNLPFKDDGFPYAVSQRPMDFGVAVYFWYKNQERVLACDTYVDPYANLRAISLTLEGLRAMERWKVSGILERTMRGFALLPPPPEMVTTREPVHEELWYEVLQVNSNCSLPVAEAAYKALAREKHPDRGGSPDDMSRLNRAIKTKRGESKNGLGESNHA